MKACNFLCVILVFITLSVSASAIEPNSDFVSVLIRYKRDSAVEPIRLMQMQKQTLDLQKKLLAKYRLQNAESFQPIWLIHGSFAKVTAREIKMLQVSPLVANIRAIRRSKLIEPFESNSMTDFAIFTYGLQKIGMPIVRQQFPQLRGSGIRVGIVDTGIDAQHADLKGKLLRFRNWISPGNSIPRDDHGHGTHVAGSIAGEAASGTEIGVAPEVQLVVAKAFDGRGNSNDGDLLQALQWMADPDGNPATDDAVHVISNSWEVDADISQMNPQDEPFCQATENLRKLGIVSVFAAGNSGTDRQAIRAPGACPAVITVGATDINDQSPSFSSRGPARWKSVSLKKPDISAPGYRIFSAAPGGGYTEKSGTSMAAPHVAGVLALMIQSQPEENLDQLQTSLMSSAVDLGTPGIDSTFGEGRINAPRALQNRMSW